MAYSANNPPRSIAQLGLTSGQALWLYESSDPHTTVDDAAYFVNPHTWGLKVGDLMIVVDTNLNTVTHHRVTAITKTYTNPQNTTIASSTGGISAATLA